MYTICKRGEIWMKYVKEINENQYKKKEKLLKHTKICSKWIWYLEAHYLSFGAPNGVISRIYSRDIRRLS